MLGGLAIALIGCGSDSSTGTDTESPPPGPTVTVSNNQFGPSSIDVSLNTTVTWQWNSGGVAHNVTFQDGPASGDKTSGSFPRTFNAAGTYHYMCTIHGSQGMTGVVNVAGASNGGGGGSGAGGGGNPGGGGGYGP